LTEVSGEDIKDTQDEIFEYLEESFGLSFHSTGYSHTLALGDEELTLKWCDGMTQDLEFMLLKDVVKFVTWLKDLPEICHHLQQMGLHEERNYIS